MKIRVLVLSEGAVYVVNGEKRTGTYATTLYAARRITKNILDRMINRN